MNYQLLRNNITTGPYTKETLIQHGIYTGDMIREVGTNAWKNPTDFAEFKNVAATKPKYKITADKKVIEIKNEDTKPETKEAVLPVNSPFKRVPSAVGKKNIAATQTKPLEKKDAERPAISPVQKPAARQTETVFPEKPAVKYPSRSKENSSSVVKEVLAPLLVIGGIGFGVWIGYHKFSGSAETQTTPSIQAITTDTSAAKPIIDSSKIAQNIVLHKPLTDSSVIYAKRDSLKKIERAARKDSLTLITKNDSTQTRKQTVITNVTDEKSAATAVPEKPKETKAINKKPAAKKTSIKDYIALSLNKAPENEINGIKINVKNISDKPLNIAVIDVSYKDTSGKIIRGETLQAQNIGVGKTTTVKVPNEKKAVNISYKVSLISGDSVYLMNN